MTFGQHDADNTHGPISDTIRCEICGVRINSGPRCYTCREPMKPAVVVFRRSYVHWSGATPKDRGKLKMNCSDCRAAFRAWHRTSGNLERATFMCGRDADGPPTVLCLSRQLAAVTADRNNAARVLDVISRALRGEPLPPDTVDLALEVERVVVQRARAVAACRLALAEGTMPWESMEIVKAVVAEADKEVKP